jgi:uncharacterized protein
MRKRITRIFILSLIWAYTLFKVILLCPSHWILAQVFTLGLYLVMFGWMFVYRGNAALIHSVFYQAFAWLGSSLMGLWGTFLLLAFPVDVIFLLNFIFQHVFHAGHNFNNTLVFYHQINLTVLAISFALTVFGFLEVWRGPLVKEIPVSIPKLPDALKNLKIALISDLHVGPTIHKNYVEKVVGLTNACDADLIFITGDLADAKAETIKEYLQPLANLKARLGIFYVTGNHEYYWDAEGLIEKMRSFGFQTLINENQIVKIDGAKILIAGVTDPVGTYLLNGHRPDLEKAAQSAETSQLKILLAHRPDICFEAEELGFDLQCSGHTHAGQFFPFNLVVRRAHKYYRKLNRVGRMWLYVNPGTGYWGPANRFGIPAEISLLKLV